MIHWGVIGLGRISHRFIKSLSYSEDGKLYAAASKTKEKQEEFLKSHPDVHVYSSYQELIDDDNVDAIYIGVVHAMHYEIAKAALMKNKVVLCEKPATLTYKQTYELCELAKKKHTVFIEGIKTRFIPMAKEIKSLINKGVIGDIQRIETAFCGNVEYNEQSYLFDKEQGGALYDLGIYNIAFILDYIKAPVSSIKTDIKYAYGVDVHDIIELEFTSQQTARIEVSMDSTSKKSMKIIGTLGTIEADPFYRPTKATVHFNNGESFTGEMPYIHDDFYTEIEEVHRCIAYLKVESDYMTHQDSLDCISLLEQIKENFHD